MYDTIVYGVDMSDTEGAKIGEGSGVLENHCGDVLSGADRELAAKMREEYSQENVVSRAKLERFLSTLTEYRQKVAYTPIKELLQQLIADTSYDAYVGSMPGATSGLPISSCCSRRRAHSRIPAFTDCFTLSDIWKPYRSRRSTSVRRISSTRMRTLCAL